MQEKEKEREREERKTARERERGVRYCLSVLHLQGLPGFGGQHDPHRGAHLGTAAALFGEGCAIFPSKFQAALRTYLAEAKEHLVANADVWSSRCTTHIQAHLTMLRNIKMEDMALSGVSRCTISKFDCSCKAWLRPMSLFVWCIGIVARGDILHVQLRGAKVVA